MVLDRPEIPLAANGSERGIGLRVTRRRISGGTRSADGRDCRRRIPRIDVYPAKLGNKLWDYLGDCLSISRRPNVGYLPGIMGCRG